MSPRQEWQPPFEVPPFRPPSEAHSLLLRATRGCPWNRCAFCGMYKGLRFAVRPLGDLLVDVQAARALYDVYVRTAFIGDSDALVVPPDDLARLLETLYATFPYLERVTCYARARSLLRRRPADLRRLAAAGLTRLHVGLESGDDEVLRAMAKGVAADELAAAGLRAKEAGFSLCFYVILGLGGAERSQPHAEATAAVLNRVDPHFIRLRTLWREPNAPLAARWDSGAFRPASRRQLLLEERTLLGALSDVTSQLESDHFSNLLALRGRFPADRGRLLAAVDDALARDYGA